MKKSKGGGFLTIETILIVVIAGCMIFLNAFTHGKLTELQEAKDEAVFIKDDIVFDDGERLADEIISYLPDTYKMFELYDDHYEMLLQIQFTNEYVAKDDITLYPNIIEILGSNDEGQTTVNISGMEQDVYFKWLRNTRGETRLLIVYSTVHVVDGLWLFSLVSYLVIILVFILLFCVRFSVLRDKVGEYNKTTEGIRDELNP